MNNLLFTHTHEWLNKANSQEVVIGITEHAQQLLGDLVFIEFPKEGQTVKAGDELGVIESVKAAADFYAPISGVVTAVNQLANDNPAIINQDPYGEGWLIKLRPLNPEEFGTLLNQEQYTQQIAEDH